MGIGEEEDFGALEGGEVAGDGVVAAVIEDDHEGGIVPGSGKGADVGGEVVLAGGTPRGARERARGAAHGGGAIEFVFIDERVAVPGAIAIEAEDDARCGDDSPRWHCGGEAIPGGKAWERPGYLSRAVT
jgi:hypothetical protein